ncbi:MAG: ribonuclease H-like domain-containing protein [Candidatus Magasanikbacteria bacterium]
MSKIVFDLETKNSFNDVGGRDNLEDLKVSVVGVYSYEKDSYMCFENEEIDELAPLMQNADPLIGFSSKTFDVPVLDKYFNYKLSAVPHFDILEKLEQKYGSKVGLGDLGKANLGLDKSEVSGLKAIELYKNGEMERLKKYCIQDVRITKQLFDQIISKEHLLIPRKNKPTEEKVEIKFEDTQKPQKQLI